MALTICCPHCDQTYQVRDELAGRRVKCSGCGTAISVEISAATEEVFANILNDAVEAEQQAETFNQDHERRKGEAVFRVGLWPFHRETEIVRDENGVRVETRCCVFGLVFSSSEVDTKDLGAVNKHAVLTDEATRRNRQMLVLLVVLLCILAILIFMPRDWAIRRVITGIAGDLAKVALFGLFLLAFLLYFCGRTLLRLFHRAEVRTSVKHHQSKYKTKAMTAMKGTWRTDEMDAKYIVTLSLRDAKPLPLYRGHNPEDAADVVKRAARITGLPVKRITQD